MNQTILTIKNVKRVLLLLVILGGAYVAANYIFKQRLQGRGPNSSITTQAGESKVAQALVTKDVNEEITFNLPTDDKNPIRYQIQKAELYDEIVVKGQKATAVPGRKFLVLTIKVDNPTSITFNINTRDYVRLGVEDSEEWLAPEIHNDPVEVQAISTKYTRVGFPVDEDQQNFKIRMGEIKGDKRTIDISL